MTSVPPRILLLAALAAPTTVAAQDPARDLPCRRVRPTPSAERCVELGLERLAAGWSWEAARMFRELVQQQPERPFGYLGLALAMRDAPEHSARLCWQAIERYGAGDVTEQRIVAAYRRYYALSKRPEPGDPAFAATPPRQRLAPLLTEFVRIEGDLAAKLFAYERDRLAVPTVPSDAAATLARHDAYLATSGELPFAVPGYRALLERIEADDRDRLLLRLPRHPGFPEGARMVAPLPGLDATATGGSSWQPLTAPAFDLPRAGGGRGRLADHAGKPLLVMFALGLDCARCRARLAALEGEAPELRAAGLDLVVIGRDEAGRVEASWQEGAADGAAALPFDVLCDPAGEAFRTYGVWDEFADEPLHGTFLVDPVGRILWRDVGAAPFADAAFLLAESRRLLRAWR